MHNIGWKISHRCILWKSTRNSILSEYLWHSFHSTVLCFKSSVLFRNNIIHIQPKFVQCELLSELKNVWLCVNGQTVNLFNYAVSATSEMANIVSFNHKQNTLSCCFSSFESPLPFWVLFHTGLFREIWIIYQLILLNGETKPEKIGGLEARPVFV